MNKTVAIPSRNYKNSNQYSGVIYDADFNTDYTRGATARHIVADWCFDKQCKKNIQNTQRRIAFAK